MTALNSNQASLTLFLPKGIGFQTKSKSKNVSVD